MLANHQQSVKDPVVSNLGGHPSDIAPKFRSLDAALILNDTDIARRCQDKHSP